METATIGSAVRIPSERAAFEAWAKSKGYTVEWHDASGVSEGGYRNSPIHHAWQGWQAAMTEAVDAMQAAVMNGDLPAACEDAADWLERHRTPLDIQWVVIDPNTKSPLVASFEREQDAKDWLANYRRAAPEGYEGCLVMSRADAEAEYAGVASAIRNQPWKATHL